MSKSMSSADEDKQIFKGIWLMLFFHQEEMQHENATTSTSTLLSVLVWSRHSLVQGTACGWGM